MTKKQIRIFRSGFWLILASLAAVSVAAQEKQLPTPEQLLESARKASDLSKLGPYTLTADITFNPDNPKRKRDGTLTIFRDGSSRRTELLIGDYREVRIAVPGSTYIVMHQSVLFLTQLEQLVSQWDLEGAYPFWPVEPKRVVRRKVGDLPVVCAVEEKGSGQEFCFDTSRAVLVSRTMPMVDEAGSVGQDQAQYSSFASVDGVLYPQEVNLLRDGIHIAIHNLRIVPGLPNAPIFRTFPQAFRIETCNNETPPEAVSTPEPGFPTTRQARETSTVALARVVISNEGKVQDVQALDPTGLGFDERIKQTVGSWRFKPAACNDHKVNVELIVEVHFRSGY